MKNILSIRFVYGINNQVFNVGTDGTKKRYDANFQKYFVFGSADNVKTNLKSAFIDISNISPDKEIFFKQNEKKKQSNDDLSKNDNQAGVSCEINLDNPITRIFGAWNNMSIDKYMKGSLTSVFKISDLLPIHPLLQAINKEDGVHHGNCNAKIGFYNKNKKIFSLTPQELENNEGFSPEEAKDFFENGRPLNFYQKNEAGSGIYYLDIHIDVNGFRYYDISNKTITDDEKETLLAKGYNFEIINNKHYLIIPIEEAIKTFEWFIQSLFEWEFSSNQSTHGSLKELLRISIGFNNCCAWQASTYAKTFINDNGKESAKLQLNDIDGVYSYNTKLLEKYYINNDNLFDTYFNADELAYEKLSELGENIINNIHF